jgi:hypothetical protein
MLSELSHSPTSFLTALHSTELLTTSNQLLKTPTNNCFVSSICPAYIISTCTTQKAPFFYCSVGLLLGNMFTKRLLRMGLHNILVLLLRAFCGRYLATAGVYRVNAWQRVCKPYFKQIKKHPASQK